MFTCSCSFLFVQYVTHTCFTLYNGHQSIGSIVDTEAPTTQQMVTGWPQLKRIELLPLDGKGLGLGSPPCYQGSVIHR